MLTGMTGITTMPMTGVGITMLTGIATMMTIGTGMMSGKTMITTPSGRITMRQPSMSSGNQKMNGSLMTTSTGMKIRVTRFFSSFFKKVIDKW